MYFLQCIATCNITGKCICYNTQADKAKFRKTGVSHHSREKKIQNNYICLRIEKSILQYIRT